MNKKSKSVSVFYQRLISRLISFIVMVLPEFSLPVNLSKFLVNYIDPPIYMNSWFIQPFNGQAIRYRQLIKISEKLAPTIAIETGTYLGTSTPVLATLVSGKTYTIEYVQKFAEKAEERFESQFPALQIQLIIGDSGKRIKYILQELNPATEVVLAYLDAHWEKDFPTSTELNELISWGDNWVAIIDDFRVPGDASYGFDKYGENIVDTSIIPSSARLLTFVPRSTGESETGAKRGTAYVFGSGYKSLNFAKEFPDLRKI